MASFNFPGSPSDQDTYTLNGVVYEWWDNTSAWMVTANGWTSIVGELSVTENIQDFKGNVRVIPVSDKTASYVLTKTDVGNTISITTGNVFIPNAVFTAGDVVTIYNNSAGDITPTPNSDVTLYLAGDGDTGNRNLATRGICTILCYAANSFVISGAGVT